MSVAQQAALQEQLARVAAHERTLRKTPLNRFFQLIGPTRPFVALYRRLGPKIDPWLFRRTGGQIATKLYGFPALLLVTTGAKTGLRRTSPLLYTRDGDDFVVVGTNFGTESHPAWTNNLLKQPRAEVVIGPETVSVEARLLDRADFARIWPRFTAVYGGYDGYLKRLAGGREPRMFALKPCAR